MGYFSLDLKDNIKNNLNILLGSCKSTADMCRKVDINRQQFNKYLSGQHIPSKNTLSKIARYFNLDVDDLFRTPAEFKKNFESYDNEIPLHLRQSSIFSNIVLQSKLTASHLKDYLGVYYRYHFSSIYKGKVLKSLTYIFMRNDIVEYVTIERFPLMGENNKTGYTFRYNGICILMGDRMFMIDTEQKQNNEMTFTTLVPQQRRPVRYLHGILTGIASSSFRQPFSSRVSFEFMGQQKLSKSLLANATVLHDAESVPLEILAYLAEEDGRTLWGGAG
ncbi:helix-turn-helix transcriptional regulator [Rouxiella sp. Mn2063]|uniref:helix-turn-helix transcriptional regulator n=1 Tax=Rouxiella sp. Mn2063 TaxID=3395262 RepID=UPI003BC5F0CC